MPEAKPGALEISDETKRRLTHLRAVSDKAEAGETEARKELRLLVRSSSPKS